MTETDCFIKGGSSWLQQLHHMLIRLMVELQRQLAAEDQSEPSLMEGSLFRGSAGRRCLKNNVSSFSDVKKDMFRFYSTYA